MSLRAWRHGIEYLIPNNLGPTWIFQRHRVFPARAGDPDVDSPQRVEVVAIPVATEKPKRKRRRG